MKPIIWCVPATFALGFAIAWTVKPVSHDSTKPLSGESAADKRNTQREVRSSSPRSTPAMERAKGYLLKIEEATRNQGLSGDFLNDIPTDDIPYLIEQWKKRAGFSGLDYSEQYQIRELVKHWYEKEPQAALDWVVGMDCQKDRQELISGMVGVEAKKDLDHALALAKQYGSLEQGGLGMPSEVQDKLGECDPARFMEIMGAFPFSQGTTSSNLAFKENFDFAGVAELLAKAHRENANPSYSFIPNNFVSEWAESDPTAAWNWVSKQDETRMIFNGPDAFFKGLAATRTTEEINTFLIDQMAMREGDSSKFRLAWQALSIKPDAAQIADFLARLPGDRAMNLEHLAEETRNGSGGYFDNFKNLLLTQMTAEERKVILPKVFVANSEDSRRIFLKTLRQLGHMDAEIDAMLPKRE